MLRNWVYITTVAFLLGAIAASTAHAAPVLQNAGDGILTLVTPDPIQQAKLPTIDGLAFDNFGNLFGALEVFSSSVGGVVHINTSTGVVTSLVTGISRADQIALHTSGDFFVTSEIFNPATTNRVYRVNIGYTVGNIPAMGTTSAASLTTSMGIDDPEGVIVLDSTGPFGNVGDLYVCEDRNPGRILRVEPSTGITTQLVSGLSRPEGMAFGDFGGALAPALYVAETNTNRVLRIDSNGVVNVVGIPAAVALQNPDNVEFGPDGFLYVSEDRPAPSSRIIRIAADGTHSVFASGFGQAQGLIFDPANGDLYIAEQDFNRVWRVRFAQPPVPALSTWALVFLTGALIFMAHLRHLRQRRAFSAYNIRMASGDTSSHPTL